MGLGGGQDRVKRGLEGVRRGSGEGQERVHHVAECTHDSITSPIESLRTHIGAFASPMRVSSAHIGHK